MWGVFCDDIELKGKTETIKSNETIKDSQIRIWNYKTGQVEYYEVNEKTINKITELLKSEVGSNGIKKNRS